MKPYPFQERVKTLIQSGKSVILQAPTGAGKTYAALAPFIEGFFDFPPEVFPKKCIYTVPMRVLANQFVEVYKEYSDSYRRRFRRTLDVRIQTGEQQGDQKFEGDLIFCTVDQFLSSYLTMPYSLPTRWANLNAGALAGAYLVFDEFHLLDPDSTLPSVLYAIKQLRKLAPVLLMTATFSTSMLAALAQEMEAEVVLLPQAEASNIETSSGQVLLRQRTWYTANCPLSANEILSAHKKHTLCLCNTVRRAQSLYRELRLLLEEKSPKTRLILLHSRFLPEDRKAIEDDLRQIFGKESGNADSVIAIATQTIEVGVDITCETLHTELAPASSLIQRAGRCARYPGEQGKVIVYPVESYAPYGKETIDPKNESTWVKEMKAAYAWLLAHRGEVLDFGKEQAFINAVAAPRDEKIIMELAYGSAQRAQAVQRIQAGDRQPGDQRILVRDADSRFVLIHSEPETLLSNPLGATGFNLPTRTLYSLVKEWLERDIETDWRVKMLIEDHNPDLNADSRTDYAWVNLSDPSQLASTRGLVVNPDLAGYLVDEGFVPDRSDNSFRSTIPESGGRGNNWEGYSYHLEAYQDHVQSVIEAFQEIALPELVYPAHALEKYARWQTGSVIKTAWLVCLFHDTGKLSIGWQSWARAYQKKIGMPIPAGIFAAHTELNQKNPTHKQAEKIIAARYKRPRHAAESALACSKILAQAIGIRNESLVKAAIAAITRHHAPFADECQPYILEKTARETIEATLIQLPKEVSQEIDIKLLKKSVIKMPNSFSNLLPEPGDTPGWLAYILLARALRRADQRGTQQGND
jgi:CRISPR-associated endonuclease/helicase Cas3